MRIELTARSTRIALPAVLLAGALALIGAGRAEAFVYWANFGNNGNGGDGTTIGRASLDGTSVQQNLVTGASGPCGLAVDANFLYWGNLANNDGTTIGRASVDGSGANQSFVTGADNPCGVAADASFLYWANTGDITIGRSGLNGSSPNQSFIGVAGGPCGLAVNDTHIYWGNQATNSIGRANLNGTAPDATFISTGPDDPCGVAVNSAHVYWAGGAAGSTIGRANLDGSGANLAFIAGASNPCGVAVDDKHIYWTNSGTGTIGRANLNGTGADQGFITGADSPCGVAVDSLQRTTSAAVACTPPAAALLQPVTCTATVTDTYPGPPSPPTGTVSFSSAAAISSFPQGTDCTLAQSGPGQSGCSVRYLPGYGTNAVQGIYRGDDAHETALALGQVQVSGFTLGAVTLNPKTGTATLGVRLPGPGTVALTSVGAADLSRSLSAAGPLSLPITPSKPIRTRLRRRGRATVFLALKYSPAGGGATGAEVSSITLVKKRSRRRR